ncbi:hypothetical protein [Nonomuraea salmonea]|uniref:hypothetical protein n=1 Tax=Nonomuraea salmonea TaxID=46181 RepID=UPI0031ECEFB4
MAAGAAAGPSGPGHGRHLRRAARLERLPVPPLILTQSPDLRVLPMALWAFQGEFTVDVPAVLAAVVLSTLPMLVAYVLGRRHLVRGLTAGFGK